MNTSDFIFGVKKMDKEILVVREVAEMLRVKKQRIYQMARDGDIPFTLLGRRQYRFSKQAIEKWIADGGNRKVVSKERAA